MTDQRPPTPTPVPPPCSPCRATGRLISKLGGEEHEVQCPWCEGTGLLIREHDAQLARRESAVRTD